MLDNRRAQAWMLYEGNTVSSVQHGWLRSWGSLITLCSEVGSSRRQSAKLAAAAAAAAAATAAAPPVYLAWMG
jgi:hypothetical protein